jgi:protein-tyrosine phosphatase
MTKGYVDLHLHLLPGVDDGCQTLDDSLSMARQLVALGFVAAAPSPHNRPEYAPRDVAVAKLAELEAALANEGLALALHRNAENFFLDETLLSALGTPAARPVGAAGKYLLVEAPYQTPLPVLPDLIFRMKLKGITPLVAHPERCVEFERKGRAAEIVRSGALLQLDVGALVGRYGRTAQKLARAFLDDGLYAIGATDLHSPVKAREWVGDSLAALEKAVGGAKLDELMAKNPAAILRGQPVD